MMSDKREDNLIGGLSMGGYGALKAALTYPEQYAACISLSGALDVTRRGRADYANEWRTIFQLDMQDPTELAGTEHDVFALATKAGEAGVELPRLYLWCGTEDALLEINQSFDAHLQKLGIAHFFEASEGNHSWPWWDRHIQNGLAWALNG